MELPMPQMTEHEAWKKLAADWQKALDHAIEKGIRCPICDGNLGLCAGINDLDVSLSLAVVIQMKERLYIYRKKQPEPFGHYFWGTDVEGAKERVKACLALAEESK